MPMIRRIGADRYRYDDPNRYITAKDCLSEPEVLKAYCEKNLGARATLTQTLVSKILKNSGGESSR
jgi:hypothetical protein